MESEWLTEDSDQDMSDQGRSSELPDADLAITPWGPSNEAEDINSLCTRISTDAVPPERSPRDIAMIEASIPDAGFHEQRQIDQPPPPEPSEVISPRGDQGRQQQSLDAYLNQLMRAQEEQERLEAELERERLAEELGVVHPTRPAPEIESRNSPYGMTEATQTDFDPALTVIPEPNQPPATPTEAGSRLLLPPGQVEISFWTYERGAWRHSDCFRVDPTDPSPVERAARKYTWKHYLLYDRNLQSLRPSQC
jgi:hypothetical protein